MAIQASKTCKVWIFLNPNMFYSGCVKIPGSISLSFTTFPKFFDRVSLMILLWFTIAELPLQCWLLLAGLKVFPATALYSSSFWVPEVPAFCSWIVTLQAFWFCVAPLGAWEGHICSSFLVFRGTHFELSQSHLSCAACPKDPEPLATSEYPDLVLLLDF